MFAGLWEARERILHLARDRLGENPLYYGSFGGTLQFGSELKALTAAAFLRAAVTYYAGLGATVKEIMTDNGSCYRSRDFAQCCRDLGLRHHFTKPYTPRTNGKAESAWSTSSRRCTEHIFGRRGKAALKLYVDALMSLGTTADVR
jgi:asparagine synthetase B (glutamine-hydrolysing)